MLGFDAVGHLALGQVPSGGGAAPPGEDSYHQPWSLPVRQKIDPRLAIALMASGMAAISPQALTQPELVSIDRWLQPLSEPVRVKPALRTGLNPAQFLVKGAPFPELVSIDRWLRPLSEPVRIKPRLVTGGQPASFLVEAAPFPEATTPDRWMRPLSEPVRVKPRLLPGANPYFQAPPFPTPIPSLAWFRPLVDPVKVRARLLPGLQPSSVQTFYTTQLVMAALEQPDIFAGTFDITTTLTGANVNVIEISPVSVKMAAATPQAIFVNVAIIEIKRT